MMSNTSYIPNMFEGSYVKKIDQTPNSQQFQSQYPLAAQDWQQAQQRYAQQGPYYSQQPSAPQQQGMATSPLSYSGNYYDPASQGSNIQQQSMPLDQFFQQQQQANQSPGASAPPNEDKYNGKGSLLASVFNSGGSPGGTTTPPSNNVSSDNNIQSTSPSDKPWRLFF